MRERRRPESDQEGPPQARQTSASGLAPDDDSRAARRQVESQMSRLTGGPFHTPINEALAQSFGADLSGLTASFGDAESTRALGAEAYSRGPHMVFGPGVAQDPGDARSMEVIGHEVAHALGGAGPAAGVDRPGGAAETAAADAGREFAGWVAAGQAGRAPDLRPVSGEAAIHRMSVGGPGGIKDPVHEELTLQTLIRAGILPPDAKLWDPQTIEYLRGVYWNDDPESRQFRDTEAGAPVEFATGFRWLMKFLFGDEKRNLTARSHHGDLQFLHAMGSKDGEAPELTRANAGTWARFTVEVALGLVSGETTLAQTRMAGLFGAEMAAMTVFALFGLSRPDAAALRQRATGSLLHLVQDSHAEGHTERNAHGEIVEFHSYTGQDHDEHGEYDDFHGKRGVDSVPGGAQAIDQGARVLELLQNGDPELVMAYIMDVVLRLAPDARPSGPGEELRPRRGTDIDRLEAPEGFTLVGRNAEGVDFRARLPAADGTEVEFTLQYIEDQQGGKRWILWRTGKLGALGGGGGFPSTRRLYLDINPALGHPAGTLPRR